MRENLFNERRSLQDIDCLVLDAILFISFDWRELANRLVSNGREVPQGGVGVLELPHVIYRMAHAACRMDSDLAKGIGATLDCLYRDEIESLAQMEIKAICSYACEMPIRNRSQVAGFLWALATDERDCVQKIARVFVRRIIAELFCSAYRLEMLR